MAYERALHPTISHTVPLPARHATFHWKVRPAGGTFKGRVYSDGSRLDGPTPLLARNGWAFVVMDEDDSIVASAYGLPPDWVVDIPGTEAWALLQAASLAEPGCGFFVDCEPCVKAVHEGRKRCCTDKNPLARVHTMMHEALEGVLPEQVVWMPSHVKPGHCGTTIRGDGFLLTESDVAGNAEADTLAKRAVEAHRVPKRVKAAIKAHNELVTDNAMWIARATVIANQQASDPFRDTQASKKKAAEAAAVKRKLKAEQKKISPITWNPQTGKRSTTKLRPTKDGGHVLHRRGTGWWCVTCRAKSLTWSRLAPQTCRGRATDTWSAKEHERSLSAGTPGNKHCIVVSHPLFWCVVCGAYGETAPKLLTKPCRRRLQGKWVAGGMLGQLKVLRSGRHPKTLQPIPPPHPAQGVGGRAREPPSPSPCRPTPARPSPHRRRGCPHWSFLATWPPERGSRAEASTDPPAEEEASEAGNRREWETKKARRFPKLPRAG